MGAGESSEWCRAVRGEPRDSCPPSLVTHDRPRRGTGRSLDRVSCTPSPGRSARSPRCFPRRPPRVQRAAPPGLPRPVQRRLRPALHDPRRSRSLVSSRAPSRTGRLPRRPRGPLSRRTAHGRRPRHLVSRPERRRGHRCACRPVFSRPQGDSCLSADDGRPARSPAEARCLPSSSARRLGLAHGLARVDALRAFVPLVPRSALLCRARRGAAHVTPGPPDAATHLCGRQRPLASATGGQRSRDGRGNRTTHRGDRCVLRRGRGGSFAS